MASSSRNNNGSLLFKSEKPRFFKVILAHSLSQLKLGLPPKFVRSHGDFLSCYVILKVPSGVKWNVKIVKSDGEIWLQNGWPEFAEYYSVLEGFFLVFEYVKSDSEFYVTIFDKSETEIDYPFTLTNNLVDEEQIPKEPNVVVDEQESDVSVEILSSTTLNRNAQAQDAEKQRANSRTKSLTMAEKAKAVERAMSNFQSENPSFRVVIQPAYIDEKNVFAIPSSFVRKYLNNNGHAILSSLDGRSWSVKYRASTSSRKTTTKINSCDWYKFVKDNDLQVGDVCIFELLLEYVDGVIFRVTISKYSSTLRGNSKQSKEKEICSKQPKLSSERPKHGRVPKTCNGTRKKIKLESSVRTLNRDCPKGQVEGMKKTKERSNFNSGNPTFRKAMEPLNFFDLNKYYLYVPRHFVKNMEEGSQKVKLQVDNKLWSVNLYIGPYVAKFSEGWIKFARQNSLKAGDVCTFELIDSEISLIAVTISRD